MNAITKSILALIILAVSQVCLALDIDVNKAREYTTDFTVGTVVVGSPEVADFKVIDDHSIYIFGKSSGQTNIIINGKQGETRTLPVTVNDFHGQATTINTLLANEGFKDVRAIDMGSSLTISGNVNTSEDIDYIKKLVQEHFAEDQIKYSLITQKNQQIKIRVTVAEVSKKVTETLGIDWGNGTLSGSNSALSISGGLYSSMIRGMNFSSLGVAINALAKNNLANVLTTPSLTVTNGKTASFHGGGQIPIFQRSENGSSVEWKDYGVKLNFAPVINTDSSISMDVTVESSQLGGSYKYEDTELPIINTRNVATSVRMRDGESFVLGGLIDNSQTQYVNKIPGLSDIPILGALFKSASFDSGRSELVIFATVEYVKPTERSEINLPFSRLSSPWQTFFDINDSNDKSTVEILKEADYVID
ncbi:pilus assembly protein N-terminal domain-containing protein [Enterobacteriaceae bacterium BIT-l23]|uniref:type II and III secretion system protein family protein n=1 Tax=Jejubacter sp. L23 TaxID=3092086 RepID=UPI001584C8F4|nr:pilus assembly protein N-terminal domain-containing protein [Enterobacteriaceae bacterium BIT-l23]